jgi:hypothetical protein
MNTNVLVYYLYEKMKNIPDIFSQPNSLPRHSTPGNPLAYVSTMIRFLGLKSIRVEMINDYTDTITFLDGNTLFAETANIKPDSITQLKLIENGKPPDLLIVPYDTHYMKNRHKYYFLKMNQYKYKLDCITIASTSKSSGVGHSSSLLTINGKFYFYDGADDTGVKLKQCNWKHWLNTQNAPSFKISENATVFSIKKNTCELYYYRVK